MTNQMATRLTAAAPRTSGLSPGILGRRITVNQHATAAGAAASRKYPREPVRKPLSIKHPMTAHPRMRIQEDWRRSTAITQPAAAAAYNIAMATRTPYRHVKSISSVAPSIGFLIARSTSITLTPIAVANATWYAAQASTPIAIDQTRNLGAPCAPSIVSATRGRSTRVTYVNQ